MVVWPLAVVPAANEQQAMHHHQSFEFWRKLVILFALHPSVSVADVLGKGLFFLSQNESERQERRTKCAKLQPAFQHLEIRILYQTAVTLLVKANQTLNGHIKQRSQCIDFLPCMQFPQTLG